MLAKGSTVHDYLKEFTFHIKILSLNVTIIHLDNAKDY